MHNITVAIAARTAARVANGALRCAAAAAAGAVPVIVAVVAVAVARRMRLHLNELARRVDASAAQRGHSLRRCQMLLLLPHNVVVVVVGLLLLLIGCCIECIYALLHLRRMRHLMAMLMLMLMLMGAAAQRRHCCGQWRRII